MQHIKTFAYAVFGKVFNGSFIKKLFKYTAAGTSANDSRFCNIIQRYFFRIIMLNKSYHFMHCLKLFSVGTFLKISALKTFRKKIYQPVEPAHYFKLITVKRVFGTVVYLVYKTYNNTVIEIIPAENTIRLRVYTDIINIFFRRILIKQRGVENGANKFAITNIFPKSVVQLPRVHPWRNFYSDYV